MIFAGIYKNELSVINVFPSIQCFCLNISEMNRIESTSYSVLITRGISRYCGPRYITLTKRNTLSNSLIIRIVGILRDYAKQGLNQTCNESYKLFAGL